jgi:hypothetical protein
VRFEFIGQERQHVRPLRRLAAPDACRLVRAGTQATRCQSTSQLLARVTQPASSVDVVTAMRWFAAHVVALLVVLVAAQGALASGPRPACDPHSGHVIASNGRAVVYKIGLVSWGPQEAHESLGGIYGCVRDHVRYRLGQAVECGKTGCTSGIYREALAGTLVAYAWEDGVFAEEEQRRPHNYFIVVRDLQTGHVRLRIPSGPCTKRERGATGSGSVTSIVMRPDGAVAWIAYNWQLGFRTASGWVLRYFVYARDRGHTRVLGSGTTPVHQREPVLSLRGHRLHWVQNGNPRSAWLG